MLKLCRRHSTCCSYKPLKIADDDFERADDEVGNLDEQLTTTNKGAAWWQIVFSFLSVSQEILVRLFIKLIVLHRKQKKSAN